MVFTYAILIATLITGSFLIYFSYIRTKYKPNIKDNLTTEEVISRFQKLFSNAIEIVDTAIECQCHDSHISSLMLFTVNELKDIQKVYPNSFIDNSDSINQVIKQLESFSYRRKYKDKKAHDLKNSIELLCKKL